MIWLRTAAFEAVHLLLSLGRKSLLLWTLRYYVILEKRVWKWGISSSQFREEEVQ